MPLRILKQSVDGQTGYVTCTVCIEEVVVAANGGRQTTTGPEETLVIAPEALMRGFHARNCQVCPDSMTQALETWLAQHHDAVQTRKQHIDHVRTAAEAMQGKLLFHVEQSQAKPGPEPKPEASQPVSQPSLPASPPAKDPA